MLTSSYALPYIDTLSFDIPHGTLRVYWPKHVDFPSASSVAHESRHGEGGYGCVEAVGQKKIGLGLGGGGHCKGRGVVFMGRGGQTCRARDRVVDARRGKKRTG